MEHYEIQVIGHLDQRRAHALGCELLRLLPDGRSLLRFAAVDQAALYGLLGRLRDAGLQLVATGRVTGPVSPDGALVAPGRGRSALPEGDEDVNVLVAYASKYGATRAIAERLADRLRAAGLEAQAQPVTAVSDLSGYSTFVIGGAAYLGHWLKEATEFVRRNQAVLTVMPVWLFSSGPLGTEPTDAQGRDKRGATEPKEFAEFKETIKPIGTRVFFGALDPGKLGFRNRAMRTLPAGRALLPEGDFRDWPDIDAWAAGIAVELTAAPAGRPTRTSS